MNKIMAAALNIIMAIILIGAIQTLSFSSMMYVLEYFGEDINISVSLNVMCLALASALAQLWIFFYFVSDINILKGRIKND